MKKCIEISLDGTEEQLSLLFSYSSTGQNSQLATLEASISHTFNQTMQRDGFYGSWAQVIKNNDLYVLKMYSPHHDLSVYKRLIPAYLEAGKIAVSIYNENINEITKTGIDKMRFLLPFGLSMAKTKSVQLLHFPPLETFFYQDYLYSPTNRRWENLLGYNTLTETNYFELETIVDCVPIAAGGDDSADIAPYNEKFIPYVKKMLQSRLKATGNKTQPIVAYGGPVMDFLQKTFSDQIDPQIKDGKLEPLSLVQLKLFDSDAITRVLCANHPSKYLYFTDDNKKADFKVKKEIMTQDLIAAGWQIKMAAHPNYSAKRVLQEMKDYWTNSSKVLKIMKQEDESYGYKL